MKPEDVRYMFNDVVERTEQLFFSPAETMDNRLLNLPSFLAALASIVKEMGEVRGKGRDESGEGSEVEKVGSEGLRVLSGAGGGGARGRE